MKWTTVRASSAAASETVLSVASDWTPWAVASAPALVIGHALSRHEQPWYIVAAAALAVELAGVLAGHTLTEAREYNALRRKAEHRRLWPIGGALIAYAVVSMALSVVLDVWPDLVTYWPVLMSPLAVVVYYVYGERLVIRHARSPLSTESEHLDAPLSTGDEQPSTGDEQRDFAAWLVDTQPSLSEVAKRLGVQSRTTASRRIQELVDAGVIGKNGHGYEWRE